ncbi:MAG TPA: YdcF family protein [Methylotenera sp.]|nr:YdcF family protein [Methylotenera sp.]
MATKNIASTVQRMLTWLIGSLGVLLALKFLPAWLRFAVYGGAVLMLIVYLSLYAIVAKHAYYLLAHPPTQKADAALILGNKSNLNGAPNPCLTGRVDAGLALAQAGLVSTLVMTGSRDDEDGAIEALAMEQYALANGFKGRILLESRSSSTQENFAFSAPILRNHQVKSVIVVSEPYHMWRAQKLVEAGHLGQEFEVTYAAAPSQCWTSWGMLFKGAFREPLAIVNNYAKGYF